ncbi:MAG: DUF5305 family protein [Bacilli bacterium]|nr:DUF5305 family protein [Bacilli bacterium]
MKDNKTFLYYGLMVVLLILIGVSSFFFNYFYNMRGKDLSIENMIVSESNKMSYNVKQLDNEFFKSSSEDESYVLSLIDNINTYYNISTAFSSPVNGEYSCFVKGYIVMHQNNEEVKNVIYNGDVARYTIDGSVINLSNTFDIDFDSIYNEYQNQIKNLGIDVQSEIRFDITYNYQVFSEKLGKSIVNSRTLDVLIPISDITNIKISEDKDEMRNEFSELNQDDDAIYVIICLEFLGAIIIFVLLIVLIVKRVNGSVSVYQDRLNKIINDYSSELVNLSKLPDLTRYDIIFVQGFDDILEISRKLNLPINYIEVIEKHESTFIVLKNNQSYVYKLNSKNA